MATLSTIVDDVTIQKFKDAIPEYKRIRKEIQFAIDAGLEAPMTVKQIDDKIAATVKIIEAYTGQRYTP